jgi:hypothetical protein
MTSLMILDLKNLNSVTYDQAKDAGKVGLIVPSDFNYLIGGQKCFFCGRK